MFLAGEEYDVTLRFDSAFQAGTSFSTISQSMFFDAQGRLISNDLQTRQYRFRPPTWGVAGFTLRASYQGQTRDYTCNVIETPYYFHSVKFNGISSVSPPSVTRGVPTKRHEVTVTDSGLYFESLSPNQRPSESAGPEPAVSDHLARGHPTFKFFVHLVRVHHDHQ